jgi:hypothetical protein
LKDLENVLIKMMRPSKKYPSPDTIPLLNQKYFLYSQQ